MWQARLESGADSACFLHLQVGHDDHLETNNIKTMKGRILELDDLDTPIFLERGTADIIP